MAFELKILTDLTNLPKVVETNIDEISPVIDAAIERVKNLEVTDNRDDIVAADEDAAKLTKMKDAIARFRIDHVKLWKTPMDAFESKCKEAEKRLTEAAGNIRAKTGEVKELWRSRKAKKCAEILEKVMSEQFPGDENADIRTSHHIVAFIALWTNPKTKGTWLNSTVKESAVEKQITDEAVRMKSTIAAMMANYSNEPEEVKAAARLALLEKFDMNDVIVAVNDWKAKQERIAAIAKAEAERKAKEEAARAAAPAPAEVAQPTTPAPAAAIVTPAPATTTTAAGVPVETYRLAITGTRDALVKMRQYGESLGITFKNLDNIDK